MTDLDVLARRAAPGWTRVAKGLCEAAPPEFVGPQITTALTRHLREHGGLDCVTPTWNTGVSEASVPSTDEVVAGLVRLTRSLAADRVLPAVVGSVYASMDDADAQLSRCLASSRLAEVAAILLRHPTGVRLRAPRRRLTALAHLLAERAPLGARAGRA